MNHPTKWSTEHNKCFSGQSIKMAVSIKPISSGIRWALDQNMANTTL